MILPVRIAAPPTALVSEPNALIRAAPGTVIAPSGKLPSDAMYALPLSAPVPVPATATLSAFITATFSGRFGVMTISVEVEPAKSDRSALASATFCASVNALGAMSVGMVIGAAVSPIEPAAFSVTVRPCTFASLMTGFVPVTVLSAPGEMLKASSRSVQELPFEIAAVSVGDSVAAVTT